MPVRAFPFSWGRQEVQAAVPVPAGTSAFAPRGRGASQDFTGCGPPRSQNGMRRPIFRRLREHNKSVPAPRSDIEESVLDTGIDTGDLPRMGLHPVLAEKLAAALAPAPPLVRTRRDAVLPRIAGKVHSVIGMRRAGKTTFLRQLLDSARERLPVERAIYLSLDDDRLAGIGADQLAALLEEYFRLVPDVRGKLPSLWLLDEVQLVPGWERFARRVLDTEQVDLVVSGSSAHLLSREVHTSLRGRGVATIIRPFSFREFLRHRREEPERSPKRWTPAERSALERRLREFLTEGGFPETQGLDGRLRVELLQGYVDTVIFRDIVERYAVTQVAALRWIVRHALRNPAGRFSANRLFKDLQSQGLGVGRDQVYAMLGHLGDAFLLGTAFLATDSERQRNTNARNLYPADPGLVRAFDASGRNNIGHALETAVFNELERRGAEVAWVKAGDDLEVDFLARFPDREAELVQVCADVSDPATLARELRALDLAAKQHRSARARLLVMTREDARAAPSDQRVMPVAEWLLAE